MATISTISHKEVREGLIRFLHNEGLNTTWLAAITGIPRTTLSFYFADKKPPTPAMLTRAQSALAYLQSLSVKDIMQLKKMLLNEQCRRIHRRLVAMVLTAREKLGSDLGIPRIGRKTTTRELLARYYMLEMIAKRDFLKLYGSEKIFYNDKDSLFAWFENRQRALERKNNGGK